MALIKCHECGKKISNQARICPQCGAKPKSKIIQAGKYVFWGILILSFSLPIIGTITKNKNDAEERTRIAALSPQQQAAEAKKAAAEQKERDEAGAEWAAVYACRNFIEKSLKDPDSVKYPDGDSGTTVDVEKDGTYRVRVTTRAKNSFGALIPSVFQCRVRHTDGDNWRLIHLKEIPIQ